MQKNTRAQSPVAPVSVTTSGSTTITSVPGRAAWEKTVHVYRSEEETEKSDFSGQKLIVRDDVTSLLSQKLLNDEEFMGKVTMYLALLDKRAINEARQRFILTMKSDLLEEVKNLKHLDRKAHSLRIRQIEGKFTYALAPLYKLDPQTRRRLLDADGQPIPVMDTAGVPVQHMEKVRMEPKDGQNEGRFLMEEDGIITDIIIEQTEGLYGALKRLNEMISVVKRALEAEVGRPLKASLAERDDTLEAKFRALFPNAK